MSVLKSALYNQEYFKEMKPYASRKRHIEQCAKPILDLKPKRVLDVGCGHGYLVKYLRAHNIEAWGVDCSPYAGEEIPKWFYRADALWLPFDKHYFDVIYSSDFLEHLDLKELEKVLYQMRVKCKEDGKILAYVCYQKEKRKNGVNTHKTVKPQEWWQEFLEERGVELILRRR